MLDSYEIGGRSLTLAFVLHDTRTKILKTIIFRKAAHKNGTRTGIVLYPGFKGMMVK